MIKIDFKWQLHKWRAITFIVLGRKAWAIETFEDMLADYPNDAYALGSLAHLYAEVGDKQASINMSWVISLKMPGLTLSPWSLLVSQTSRPDPWISGWGIWGLSVQCVIRLPPIPSQQLN